VSVKFSKCNNSLHLRSCTRNVNKPFWRHCQEGSQYLLSIYRLQRIIVASIISLVDLSSSLCLCVVFTGKILFRPEPPLLLPEVYIEILLVRIEIAYRHLIDFGD
jgi:hypothetical protein